jgi:GNAT superfamily N-acetyltransferase
MLAPICGCIRSSGQVLPHDFRSGAEGFLMQPVIEVSDAFPAELLAKVTAGLGEANTSLVGPANRVVVAALARPPGGDAVAGGVICSVAWGWLYIAQLWVAPAWRRQGLAARLIAAAETEGVRRGCRNAWIDTFNPAALRLYTQIGYREFGALEDFPPGHQRTFLRKPLLQGEAPNMQSNAATKTRA